MRYQKVKLLLAVITEEGWAILGLSGYIPFVAPPATVTGNEIFFTLRRRNLIGLGWGSLGLPLEESIKPSHVAPLYVVTQPSNVSWVPDSGIVA